MKLIALAIVWRWFEESFMEQFEDNGRKTNLAKMVGSLLVMPYEFNYLRNINKKMPDEDIRALQPYVREVFEEVFIK